MRRITLPAIAILLAVPAAAEDIERYRELSQGAIAVTMDITGSAEGDMEAMIKVTEDGQDVLSERVMEIFSPIAIPEISFTEMDTSNATPEILVSRWTGGAHCCNQISVYSKGAGGWSVLDAGAYDGEPLEAADRDGDGQTELVTYDNAFFYKFSSYAGSYAPPQVIGIRDGKIADISAEPGFKPLFEAYLKDMGEIPESGSDRNSWLAAYAATLVRLGQDDPLDYAEGAYDKNVDWGLTGCAVDMVNGECPPGKETNITFPEALRAFLTEQGYLEAAE